MLYSQIEDHQWYRLAIIQQVYEKQEIIHKPHSIEIFTIQEIY